MQEIQVYKKDGCYTCDIGITVGMWKSFLQDSELITPDRLGMLVKFYNEPDHKSTCRTLAMKYDNEVISAPQKYNSLNTNLGKAICKKLDLSIQRTDNSGECFWIVAMEGRELDNGWFEWKLRPELITAMQEIPEIASQLKETIIPKHVWLLAPAIDDKLTIKLDPYEMFYNTLVPNNILSLCEWDETGDLTKHNSKEEIANLLMENVKIYKPETKNSKRPRHSVTYLYRMVNEASVGDIVFCLNKTGREYTIVGKGNVSKAYYFDDSIPHCSHRLGVTWERCNIPLDDIAAGTYKFSEIFRFMDIKGLPLGNALMKAFNLPASIVSFPTVLKIINKKSTMEEIEILKEKKQIILQGAPGTGKTYKTASIAVGMCNPTFTDFDDHKKVMEEYDRLLAQGQIAFCTFHQSMDYEDFVEGLKPEVKGNAVEYNVENGIFKTICEKAQTKENADIATCIDKYLQTIKGFENRKTIPTITGKSELYVWWTDGNDTISTRSVLSKSERGEQYSPSPLNIEKVKLQALGEGVENNWRHYAQAVINAVKKEYNLDNQVSDKPYVLIIDEINRGNVSKIFGELITLLEADKRCGEGSHHISLKLPYSKEDFSVPSNLYIIGTMNTTDRSTGTIDYAVRRRFAFVTLESKADVIENWCNAQSVPANVRDAALALFAQINGISKNDSNSFIAKHKATDFELEDLKVGHSYFMAKDLASLKMKMRYEVVPLIKEYIKDGILRGTPGDDKYFDKWLNAECYNQSAVEYVDE